jgi:hypothetical protein
LFYFYLFLFYYFLFILFIRLITFILVLFLFIFILLVFFIYLFILFIYFYFIYLFSFIFIYFYFLFIYLLLFWFYLFLFYCYFLFIYFIYLFIYLFYFIYLLFFWLNIQKASSLLFLTVTETTSICLHLTSGAWKLHNNVDITKTFILPQQLYPAVRHLTFSSNFTSENWIQVFKDVAMSYCPPSPSNVSPRINFYFESRGLETRGTTVVRNVGK